MIYDKVAPNMQQPSSFNKNDVDGGEGDSDSSNTPLISKEDRNVSNTHTPAENVLKTDPIPSTSADESVKLIDLSGDTKKSTARDTQPLTPTTENLDDSENHGKARRTFEIRESKQSEKIVSTPKKDANLSLELENEIRHGNKQSLDRAISTPFSSNVSLSNPLSPIRDYKTCKSYEKGGI